MTDALDKAQNLYHRGIHRLAVFIAVWTFLVVCLGGTTKSKRASLTIAEPILFRWEPSWLLVNNLREEYSHRVAVGVLAIGTLALFCWIVASAQRKSLNILAGVAMLMIVAQAALGALTVAFFAHPPTSIPHAVMGQLTFCALASIAVITSKAWCEPVTPKIGNSNEHGLRRLAVTCGIAFFVQLLLGAALRHDDNDAPLRNHNMFLFVSHLMAHFLGAMAVLYFAFRLIMRIFRQHRDQAQLLWPARAMMILLTLQLALGFGATALKMLTFQEESPPFIRVVVATSHVATGALLLALSVISMVGAYRYTLPAPKQALETGGAKLGVAA